MQMFKKFEKFINLGFRDLTSLGSFVFHGWILLLLLALMQWQLFYQLLFGLIFTLLITIIIRSFYFKKRPKEENYKNYLEKLDASSFPSLHSARTVYIALMFILVFNHLYTTILLTLFAIMVCYSRIYIKKHYFIDVLGGVALGIISYLISMSLF